MHKLMIMCLGGDEGQPLINVFKSSNSYKYMCAHICAYTRTHTHARVYLEMSLAITRFTVKYLLSICCSCVLTIESHCLCLLPYKFERLEVFISILSHLISYTVYCLKFLPSLGFAIHPFSRFLADYVAPFGCCCGNTGKCNPYKSQMIALLGTQAKCSQG